MKILLMSDLHFCHSVWYNMDAVTRMEHMIAELNRAYEQEPYEAILFLGDYSLDFWGWSIGGCYVHDKYSYTERFVKEILPRLHCKNTYMIPGNHEQYSHADWLRITGHKRQFSLVLGGVLYLMLDTFAGELDPDYDSDGLYTGADVGYIRSEMEKYPFILAEEQDLPNGMDMESISLIDRDRPVLVVDADHPLAGRETVDIREIAEETMVLPVYDQSLHRITCQLLDGAGIPHDSAMECSYMVRRSMVMNNHAVSFSTACSAKYEEPGFRYIPIRGSGRAWNHRLFMPGGRALLPQEELFRDFAVRFFGGVAR